LGFVVFVFALPVSCCGFVLYNEHLNGDAQSGGPAAILAGMGVSAVVALAVMAVVWRKTRPR
jgi:hypothetical protein